MERNMSAQAQVLWLPEEEVPAIDSFSRDHAEPSPNPETRRYLEDALLYPCCVERDDDKVPWIVLLLVFRVRTVPIESPV